MRAKPQTPRIGRREDLDDQLIGKEVEILLSSQSLLRGRVVEVSRFRLKLENEDGVFYINKPFIVYIKIKP